MFSRNKVTSSFVAVAVGIPLILTLVALALQLSWRSELPQPIATHWGPAGGPDGFGTWWTILAITGGVGFGLPVLVVATTLPALRRGARGMAYRFMAAFSAGMGAYFAALTTGLLAIQRGLDDAANAPAVHVPVFAAFGVGVGVGLLGWWCQPRQHARHPHATRPDALDLANGERAVWMGNASLSRPVRVLLLSFAAIMVALAVWVWVIGDLATGVIATVGMAFALTAVAMFTQFHARVDATGLAVVSAVGWPRIEIPVADVADVTTSEVNGFGEFGGYGFRWVPGAVGIITRNGNALRVRRRDGRTVVATLDDAETAAALLRGYARRAGVGSAE